MAINNVGLRETLEALRVELSKSILASEGEQIRFEVGEIELEVQFVVEQSKEGKGGLKFWVVEMGGGVTNKDTITHRIKIPRLFSTLCDNFCLCKVKCLLGKTFRTILKEETISIDLVYTQKPEEPFPLNPLGKMEDLSRQQVMIFPIRILYP
ncbi:hypothetical protein MICAF_3330012 [Microcystis aeruginosa PCC 9807]|uniref:Trypsin-co-occurring domain-containing protein n=1 Tax=Microcystis aeruginosa PCC 9807 TaxID=1160283 RepID=I4H790_MICAE|nr:hypothetical protein MICAF_3330012 [Microcystis aeruginosa PCC 9807]